MSRHRVRLVAVALAALMVAGCTPSTSPPGPASGNAAPSSNPSSGDELTYRDMPLYRYRMLISGNGLPPNATEQEKRRHQLQQQNEIQRLIAACMAREGFEYRPRIRDEEAPPDPAADDWDPNDRASVSRYGYGLADEPGRVSPNAQPDEDESSDLYWESLTPQEQEAFQLALNGAELTAEEDYNWRKQGCRGAAQHEVLGYQPWQDSANQPILDAIDEFSRELDTHAAFAALHAEWAGCMAEHDYPGFRRQSEARASIQELLSAYHPDTGDSDDPRLKDPAFATLDDPAYAEIARQEVALALADLDCREQTDYDDHRLRIQFDLEERFIVDHQEELDALEHRAEQGS